MSKAKAVTATVALSIFATFAALLMVLAVFASLATGKAGFDWASIALFATGNWLPPVLLLSLALPLSEADGELLSLSIRLRETRNVFALLALAWLVYLLVSLVLWLSRILSLPHAFFYTTFPAVAYTYALPSSGKFRPFRVVAVGLALAAAFPWAILVCYAPWPSNSAVVALAGTTASLMGLALAIIIVLLGLGTRMAAVLPISR